MIILKPSTPLRIYLFNQVSCTCRAAASGWRRRRGNTEKGTTKESLWRKHTASQKASFFFCATCNFRNAQSAFCKLAVANIQRSRCLELFRQKSRSWCVNKPRRCFGFCFVFYQLLRKGNHRNNNTKIQKCSPRGGRRACQEDEPSFLL